MPLRGEQSGCGELAGDQIPGREHMIDGIGAVDGSGQERQPDGRVHGVVDRSTSLAVALDGQLDEIFAPRPQRLV